MHASPELPPDLPPPRTERQGQIRTVDIVVDTADIGGHRPLTLPNVPLPISFKYIAEKLVANGMYLHKAHEIYLKKGIFKV